MVCASVCLNRPSLCGQRFRTGQMVQRVCADECTFRPENQNARFTDKQTRPPFTIDVSPGGAALMSLA